LSELLNHAGLNAALVSHLDLKVKLWQKLIVNAAINPVTAILRMPNKCVADSFVRESLVLPIVHEACSVLLRCAPEVASAITLGHSDPEFLQQHMLAQVMDVVHRTQHNRSSMLVDVESGRRTEIDFINGFLLQKAKDSGLDPTLTLPANTRVADGIHKLSSVTRVR
jgi:2-dehydropantoate 2-reductase